MGRVISTAIKFIDGFTRPSRAVIESMRKMGNEAIKAGKQVQNAGKIITNAGAILTKSITLPVAGIAGGAIKTAANFEASMSKVGAISNASAKNMEKLTEKAKEMGAKTSFSASESAEAMQYMAMAGWKTADMTEGIAGIMNLAAASGEDLAATSDIVTDGLTAFGMSAKESSRFADVMAATASNANTDVALMGETFKYCASTAGAMKYSIEDISVAIGIMGNAGIKGSTAGTTLKNVIANMAKPTDSQAAVMKKLGISLTDSSGNMKSFADVMKNLRSSFSGLSETEKAAAATTLAGKQSMAGLLTIVNASEKDFNKLTKAINGSSGSAEKMAAKMLDNLNGQITLLKSAIEGIAITIGDKLLPYIKKAVSWVQTAADYINNLNDAQVNNILKWAGIAAAIGPAIAIFGKIVTTVGTAQRMFGTITKTIANFGGIIGVITSPAGVAIGVLAGIALAAVLIIKNWSKVKGFLQNVADWFKTVFQKAGFSVEEFKNKFISIKNTVGNIVGKIGSFCKSIAGIFKKEFAGSISGSAAEVNGILEMLVGNAIKAFDGIITAIDKGLQVFHALLEFFTGAFTGNWKSATKDFKNSLKNIFPDNIASGLIKIFDTSLPVIKGAVSGIKKIFSGLIQITKKVFSSFASVFRKISNVIKNPKDAITTLGNIIKNVFTICGVDIKKFSANMNNMKTRIKNILSNLKTIFFTVFHAVADIVKTKIDIIRNVIKFIVPVFKVAFGGIKGVFLATINTVTSVISGLLTIFDGITTFISGVFTGNWRKAWEGVKTIFKGVFDSFAALCKAPINAVIGIINGAISSLNKLNITIPDWVPGVGGQSFGINVPTIPMLYKGTKNWQGGEAIIHDRGAEIVDLPKGTRVYPHDKSIQMAWKAGREQSGSGTITINIQKLADKLEVRSDNDIDRIAEALAQRLRKVAFNTGIA